MSSGEEVQEGRGNAGGVVEEGINADEGPCLLKQSICRICLDLYCMKSKSHFEAEVRWVCDSTAEAIDVTGENAAHTGIIDAAARVDKSGESNIDEIWLKGR